jgi:hypothetical protein
MASADPNEVAKRLNVFLQEHGITVLNIAGPRESEEPGIGKFVDAVLSLALKARLIKR